MSGDFFAKNKILLKLKTSLEKLSLIKKLILAYIFILAFPITFFGIYLFQNIKSNIEADAAKSSALLLQQGRNNIHRNIDICERVAQSVIYNSDVMGYATNFSYMSEVDQIDFARSLTNLDSIVNTNPDIHSVHYFFSNPEIGEIWPYILSENYIIQKDWFRNVTELRGQTYWQLEHPYENYGKTVSSGNKPSVVTLFREIRYPSSEHVGVFEVNMLSATFFSDVFNVHSGLNAFMCIISGDGNILYDEENSLIKKNEIESTWIRSNLLKNLVQPEGSFSVRDHGDDFTINYTHIDKINCYLVQVYSTDRSTNTLNNTKYLVIAGIITLILLLTLVTYIITSILFRKLKLIISAIRNVQKGNMFTKIPDLGGDEIGELSKHFRNMLDKINELIFTVVRKQAATKDAEIKALHSQINAHFIYNVLESINMMAIVEYKYEISDALTLLGRLMRYSISWKSKYVLVSEEMSHIRNYISIMNYCNNHRLTLQIKMDPTIGNVKILKMLLQPLVENAVTHGLEPKSAAGTINIHGLMENETLLFEITDEGVGMDKVSLEKLQENLINGETGQTGHPKGNGIGLENVNERIRLHYGEDYGLTVESRIHEYFTVKIRLPYKAVSREEDINEEGSFGR